MEMIMHNTDRLFKNIFPSYQEFATWYKTLPLSDGQTDCPSAKTFALIAFDYNDSHVAFSPESFKEHFAIDLYTYYKEFEATSAAIDNLMSLTDEQIAISDTMVINTADIPETEGSTDDETVDFVSQQQKTLNKKGVLQIKKEQLSNKRAYTVRSFLSKFKHLFIKVISPAFTQVYVEDTED